MSKYLFEFPNKIIRFIKKKLILDQNEQKFINYNKNLWSSNKITKTNKVILVDLFDWNPFICFWSYLVNFLSFKLGAKINFFYFHFYQTKSNKYPLNLRNLKRIYKSFNVDGGISEYDFEYSKRDIKNYNKSYNKFKDVKKLINYKKDNILLGDLIWDTYIRTNHTPTILKKDEKLKKIFFRANKIYDELNNYFKKNKVICVVPSHTYYISYGIICRVAANYKVPIIKLFAKNFGNNQLHLLKLKKSNNWQNITEEYPYFEFKKIFSNFSKKKKISALNIGKKILKKRISGSFDSTIPYMKISSFNKSKKNNQLIKNHKPKIFLFPHSYIDAPHRYRSILFNDFFYQMKFFLEYSKKLTQYDWYYKPHPNELKWGRSLHKDILKNYPNIIKLDKNFSHRSIIKSKPKLIITNHGTIAHELASFKIPVLCTGDNPHINYNFCLHAKSLNHLKKILYNLDHETKKINFDKKNIYEYLYMRYEYFFNLYGRKKYLKDNYFLFKNVKKNQTSDVFSHFIKISKSKGKKINLYLNNFYESNF